MAKKSKKSETIKIGGMEIKDHRNVSFTTAFIIALVCVTVGVLAARYLFMILPARPGCVRVIVRDFEGVPRENAQVKVYMIQVIGEEGVEITSGTTNRKGMVLFCDVFESETTYMVKIIDPDGEEIWSGTFTTNKRSSAEVPVIVMVKDGETIGIGKSISRFFSRYGYMS